MQDKPAHKCSMVNVHYQLTLLLSSFPSQNSTTIALQTGVHDHPSSFHLAVELRYDTGPSFSEFDSPRKCRPCFGTARLSRGGFPAVLNPSSTHYSAVPHLGFCLVRKPPLPYYHITGTMIPTIIIICCRAWIAAQSQRRR